MREEGKPADHSSISASGPQPAVAANPGGPMSAPRYPAYILRRGGLGAGAAILEARDASLKRLDPRLDLRNHSPTGFEWGYGGSGPAQLALAICADALRSSDAPPLRFYQKLKFAAVARVPQNVTPWAMPRSAVLDWIEAVADGREPPSFSLSAPDEDGIRWMELAPAGWRAAPDGSPSER